MFGSHYARPMPSTDAHLPTKIEQHDPRTLAIAWADGAKSLIDVRALRLACGCANCIDEWSGKPLLEAGSIPADIAPRDITPEAVSQILEREHAGLIQLMQMRCYEIFKQENNN